MHYLTYAKYLNLIRVLIVACGISVLIGCAASPHYLRRSASEEPSASPGNPARSDFHQRGVASYYNSEFNGRLTASGERFSNNKLTAAHLTLPFNTLIRVTNTQNNRSVVVRINDRGPHKKNRILDLSYAAAQKLGMIASGTAEVSVEVVKNSQ